MRALDHSANACVDTWEEPKEPKEDKWHRNGNIQLEKRSRLAAEPDPKRSTTAA